MDTEVSPQVSPLLRDARRYLGKRERDELLLGPCAYCGGLSVAVDHVIPWSRGGPTTVENSAPACRPCNEQKMDSTPEEWRAWREERGMPWPPLSRQAVFRSFMEQAAAAEGITVAEMDAYMIGLMEQTIDSVQQAPDREPQYVCEF